MASTDTNRTPRLVKCAAVCMVVIGALGLLAGLAPVAWLHLGLDRFSADGRMAALDLPVVDSLRLLLLLAGSALGGVGAAALRWPRQAGAVLVWLQAQAASLRQDNRRLLASAVALRPRGWETSLLGLILAAGFFVRLVLLPAPMQYDESVTYMDFASRPLWAAISDYSLPNNHVLHTLLVHLTTRLLGDAPWTVRLPAFLAGMLIIPAAYLLGCSHYNRRVGWGAAALAAWWPQLVFYSANGRGYTLLGLFSVLLFGLGGYALKHRSPAAWAWMALIAALGLYTVPVMVYPLGILLTWLLLSRLAGEGGSIYRPAHFLACLGATGAGALLLAAAFYLPVLLTPASIAGVTSGAGALVGNKFVRSFAWEEFITRLPGFLDDIWMRFTQGMPWPVIVLVLIGLVLGLGLNRRISDHRVPPLATAVLFFIIVLPLQRPEMLSKLFFFSLPLLAVWAAAGWVALSGKGKLARAAGALLVGALVTGCFLQAWPNLPYLAGATGEHEETALWLKSQFRTGDVILADFPIDAQVLYYVHRSGLPMSAMRKFEGDDYQRAWVLVNPNERQTLLSVADRHPMLKQPLDLASAREVAVINAIHIYECCPGP